LGKLKRFFLAAMLFYIAAFNIYSQTNTVKSEDQIQVSSNSIENSIILSDNSSDAETNNNQTFQTKSTAAIFIRMIIVLIIVVVLIYFVLRFIKNKTNVVKTDDDYLRRAAYLNIAPGKTIEVITLIDKAYLIGVTEDNITMLGEIDDKELISAMNLSADKKSNTKKPNNFSDVLDMFLVKTGKQKNVFAETENQVDNIFNKQGPEEE